MPWPTTGARPKAVVRLPVQRQMFGHIRWSFRPLASALGLVHSTSVYSDAKRSFSRAVGALCSDGARRGHITQHRPPVGELVSDQRSQGLHAEGSLPTERRTLE